MAVKMHLQQQRTASLTFAISCRLLLIAVALTGNAKAQHFDSLGLSYRLRSGPSEDAILVANNGIRVPFGKSVFIDPINDLVIQVQPGDRCSIVVLENDPLTQRPGQLTPKKFPCDFGHNDVKYSHFGSRSPSKDRVKLQLRYDTQTDTIIIPFMMEVEVVFTQLEILTRNMPLTVEKLLGTSNPIDRKVLEFTFDRNSEVCKITTLTSASGLPRYGKLINNARVGKMVDCDEFVKLDARYQHTSVIRAPNRDYIPMVVELQDKEGNLLKQEYFQMMVRIREGEENTAPKPSFVAMMMMEVDQFVMTAITPDMLAAEDTESDPDDLIFNITSPLSSEQGYIVSTDDRNLPITSFHQGDLKDLKIAYKPPSEDSQVERIFQIEFEIVDTEGAVSDPFAFMIVVKPMNTLAPVVTRNTGQLLYEGQTRPLASSQNLQISDEDNLDEVRVTVIDGLRHGQLTILGSRRKFFTPADLDTGVVIYQHDGSDTYSDNIIFRMTDGKHEVEFLFPITIVPTDDEPPFINANTGLVLSKNEMVPISPFVLSATDIDSEDSTIKFTIETPFSTIGEVVLRQSEAPEDRSSWTFIADDEVFEKVVTEWFQQDIMSGKLFYRHVGPHSTSTVMDQFVFRVQDDNDPPNQSGENTFIAKILPVDDIPPELYSGTSLNMIVQEYKLTHFRKKFLRYTDLDSDDRDLKYTIITPPTDTDENNPVVLGYIVLTDSPDVTVTEFTQAQINHHKIAYKPPDLELGITAHVLQFQYTVEDTAGNSVEGTFTIFLQPVDNKPPQITNTGFNVFERGTHIITSAELDTSDADTDSKYISFTLTQPPLHGHVQYTDTYITEGDAFNLDDIASGRIAYIHDGYESTSDSFKLDVSDGVHVVTITIRVNVRPIDDEVPTIMLPAGTIGSYIDVLENGATEITTSVIQGRDEDTDDLMLTFIVEDRPLLGEILVNGIPTERFTQGDIINGVVVYAHTSGEIGLDKQEDYFNLTLSDLSDEWNVGGNKVQGVRVQVTILPVDSQAPEVTVGQQFTVVEGEKNAIELEHVSAEDIDTANDDILCTIIVQPTSGYVENISPAPGSEKSRSGTAVSAFTMKDIRLGHIYYVQSIHKGVEPVEDRFTFRCSDGINFSQRHFFPIIIVPANDEKPEIFMREFVVMEGMNIVIDTPILNAVDSDIPADDLMFIITKPPKHGFIVNQLTTGTVPVNNFTLDQIKESSSIVYEHDDSETTEDSFDVILTDGKHTVEKTVIIMVIPVDDETPRMTINDGLEIEIGESKIISNNVLKATDLDSEDKTLTYIIRYGPGQGLLQKQKPSGSFENITVGMNFTQDQVDNNLIVYFHNGQEGVRDLIKFDVTDGINPLIDRYFYITVGSIDMIFPDVISKGVSLKEGGRVTLTTDLLSTSDLNSPDENLEFTITRAPVRGHLECTDTPGVPISSFTQLQLAGNKVYYIHTSDDEVKMDSFEFEVTDGYNPVFRTFRVSITDVDNKKPVVTVHDLVVTEGENKLITPFELTVEDRDTPDHFLRLTITQVPVHGRLLFNSTRPVTSFTKQDLNENLISYKHDGTESPEDSFSFTVTDGTHTDFYVFPDTIFETRKPQMMKISIISVDNGVPQIIVNKGAPTLRILTTGHLGFMITSKALKAEDKDSTQISLKFKITLGPEHGYLINMGKGNDSITEFSQGNAKAQHFDSLGLSYRLRSGPSEDAILVANNGIRVPFGKSVFIDPINDLVIQVQPGDRCSIVVLENDPLTQRPGQLTPKKFPCDFGHNDVKYSHFGSRSPSKDRVKLQLRYDTQTDTIIIPFMMEVEVVFTQLEILTRNMPLTVEKLLGTSNPIDRKVLEFTFDRNSEVCKITTLTSASGLPRYGKLINNARVGKMVDCDEFVKLDARYQHTSVIRAPNRDYIPMVVELQDKEGNLLKQEYFQMMVRIREGEENTAPKPSFVAMMMMEVDQFVMTAITPDMLAAEDTESDPDDLIFNITSPLSSEQGYIVSTDDRNLPITSFHQGDLKDLKIAYKPPSEDSQVERIFQIEFEIVDTEGAVSDPFAFMIVVKPMNTLAPVVTRNTGQLLYEGQTRPLASSQNLQISDEDNLDEVRVTVIDGLRHGQLTILGSRRKFFTPADLDTGVVIYQHDGSDTYSDNIIFRMTDGKHEVEFLFPITIVPTDDEPPFINANTGLVLSKNEMVPISPFVLSATDIDSEDSTIKFTIEPPFSTIGEVVLRQSEAPEDRSSWTFIADDEVFEKVVTEWFQQDIMSGKLFYRHVGPHSTSTVMDQFVFRVQDDNDPPNQSGENTFIAKILPVDDIPPELYSGTSLNMIVQEYKLTHFRKKFLRYTDLDSDDRDLKYTIITPPTDTDENNPVVLGYIVLTDSPDVTVTEFTQAQINHHKIAYKPPDLELGITAHVLQFQYTVEDAAGNSVEGTFTIFLQPVDNKPPQITNTGFNVFERGTHIITSAELDTSDADTDSKYISFTLTQPPLHGHVQYTDTYITEGDAFNLDDIASGRIAYIHDGYESTSDSFKLDVSDGVHVVTITIRVNVRPIDDEVPTIMLPAGTIGSYIDVLENGATEITTSVIQGRDEDTDDLMLTFIVEDRPLLGEILVNGIPTERFTQGDIINGVVVYAHTSGEIGLDKQEDYFNLTLSDLSDEWNVGGNKVQGVRVQVTILPVDSQAPEVTVGQQFTVVEGEKNAIELEHVSAEDIDTANDDILCTIIVQPTSGYVENISPAPGSEKSRSGTAVSAFTMKDIRLGHIYYVQSIHKGVEPVEDRFTFRCSDGINFSQRHFFPIIIVPANDEKPEIFMREFVVMEGMNIVIDTPILNAVDSDIPADDLMFIITKPPKHGFIVNQLTTGTVPVNNFTLDQIKESSSIVYEHDDSETTEDSFDVILTDGKHTVEKTVIIMVIPVDDETPRMTINDGLEIEIGESKIISNNVLKATDLDSEDKTLTYIIRYGPGQGLLQKQKPSGSFENITVGMNFTQDQVDNNLIVYFHNGQEGVRDLIKFDVTDGINPLIDRYFYITVGSIDMIFPDVISKGVSLKEGGRVTLTTDLLSTSDLNSPDENLEFTITRAPVRGHLECTDTPGVPISSFTQLQLAGNKVYYIHTSDDEVKMDSFEFEVTDGYNPVFRTFRVSITDVDNKKPVVTVHDLVVTEGENKLITPFELTVEDRDTPDHFLRLTITQVPVHGRLLFNSTRPVTSFTKQDLNENLISYKHDGTESPEDSFSFTVTDGTHTDFYVFPDTIFETRKPQMMKISIISVDNGVPQIIVNKGAPTLRILTTGHLGFMITSKALKAEDKDSTQISLKFKITLGPEHGYLINMGKGNDSITEFSQADIDDMKICFVLREGDNATSDIFYFTIEDSATFWNKYILLIKINFEGPRVAHSIKALPMGVQDESHSLDGASSRPGCSKRPNFAGDSEGGVTLALTLLGWGMGNQQGLLLILQHRTLLARLQAHTEWIKSRADLCSLGSVARPPLLWIAQRESDSGFRLVRSEDAHMPSEHP
ncbi:UNVERIFIED_CONTAM: hypothetical protein FKN15_053458 [Acipenser sinensis]